MVAQLQPGRPTLEAVAALAGVSRGTVSRVINDSPQVSPRAREAVRKAIDELGFVPNRAARTLVTQRTDSVALVVSESEERFFAEPYFAAIVRGISAGLTGSGMQLLLAVAQSPTEREQLENYLTGQHVDGVLLVSLHGIDTLPARLESRGVPTVLGGRPMGVQPAACVDADNRGGARQAVEHLLAAGRRRVATIAGPQDMTVGLERYSGYRDALADAGIDLDPALVAPGDFSLDSGARAASALLDARPDLDAVFAASDAMAIGAMRALREAGRRVPEDVAVVGFEDSPSAAHTDPPLTTVHQPVEAMGREMVRLLLTRIGGEPVRDPLVVLPTHLVVRGSA
ncbi:MAG: Transcriptional regulator, LacI family [uncultured Corynebacteriales bacterium]|uniref:Transcriptional regulator, LacI family n=1 Tax=uncultured Mycobacteriales bacterium TaxID=581187 RepID=A0A6J4K1M1_9ACTN|nr:MAG: Transcriptional regulator, LacI family [uncultured Corynebacteriales bacterium]